MMNTHDHASKYLLNNFKDAIKLLYAIKSKQTNWTDNAIVNNAPSTS